MTTNNFIGKKCLCIISTFLKFASECTHYITALENQINVSTYNKATLSNGSNFNVQMYIVGFGLFATYFQTTSVRDIQSVGVNTMC